MSTRPDDEIRAGYVHHGEQAEHARVSADDPLVESTRQSELRTHALVHRYFELLEHPDQPIEPFAALFADDFAFDFTMTQIQTREQFETWATGFRNSFECFTLTVMGIAVDTSQAPLLTASIDLDFDAIDHDGNRKTMQTTHTWITEDNTIKTITVQHRE